MFKRNQSGRSQLELNLLGTMYIISMYCPTLYVYRLFTQSNYWGLIAYTPLFVIYLNHLLRGINYFGGIASSISLGSPRSLVLPILGFGGISLLAGYLGDYKSVLITLGGIFTYGDPIAGIWIDSYLPVKLINPVSYLLYQPLRCVLMTTIFFVAGVLYI